MVVLLPSILDGAYHIIAVGDGSSVKVGVSEGTMDGIGVLTGADTHAANDIAKKAI